MNQIKFLVSLAVLLSISTLGTGFVAHTCGTLPSPRTLSTAVYDGEDFVYILGGMGRVNEEVSPLDEILKYSLSTGELEVVARLPAPRAGGKAAMDQNGNIFYFGGGIPLDSVYHSDIYKLSPGSFEISKVGDLLEPLTGFTAHSIGDSIYILGGMNSALSDRIIKFNPTTTAQTLMADLPFATARATSAVVEDRVYILGGSSPKIMLFDPTNNSTEELEQTLVDRIESAVAVNIDGRVLLIGGNSNGDYPRQRFTTFNPSSGSVAEFCIGEESGAIPQVASGIYSEEHNRIYIFGGYVEEIQNGVLCIDVATIQEKSCTGNNSPSVASKSSMFISLTFILSAIVLMSLKINGIHYFN